MLINSSTMGSFECHCYSNRFRAYVLSVEIGGLNICLWCTSGWCDYNEFTASTEPYTIYDPLAVKGELMNCIGFGV